MDCRKRLVVALIVGAAGCVPQTSVQTIPPPPPGAVIEKAQDLPRHPPKHPDPCVAAGSWLVAEGDHRPQGSAEQERFYDQARKAFEQALDIDANCLSAYQALGQLCMKMGDHDGAVKWYRKGLEKQPQEGSLWLNLGMCYARHKEWDPAIEALRRATECDPENRQYQNMLGCCLARAGRYDEAMAPLRKGGGEAMAHYRLGFMLYQANQDAEAREQLRTALKEAPTYEPALRLLAQLEGRAPADPALKQAGFETPIEDGMPPR
ncbi:MAG TPA: tetratricopeptide repeat protein [Gemmataceae bacterium]|nr:tetratricopeptide repeat protein [Gemmataceae bacterium]